MNDYGVIVKPARVLLMMLALSMLMSCLLVAALSRLRTAKVHAIGQTQQQLANTGEHIRKLTVDLNSIHRQAAQYQRLSLEGFFAEPDSERWLAALDAIYRDTRLPPALRYTLAPAQLINPQAVADEAPSAYRNRLLQHDLRFELSGIHEGEFLDFMDKLTRDWHSPYRVDACQFNREEDNPPTAGLQIKCTLQLYSMPEKTPEKTVDSR